MCRWAVGPSRHKNVSWHSEETGRGVIHLGMILIQNRSKHWEKPVSRNIPTRRRPRSLTTADAGAVTRWGFIVKHIFTDTCTHYLFEGSHSRVSWFLSHLLPGGVVPGMSPWGLSCCPLPILRGGEACAAPRRRGWEPGLAGPGGPFVPRHL